MYFLNCVFCNFFVFFLLAGNPFLPYNSCKAITKFNSRVIVSRSMLYRTGGP